MKRVKLLHNVYHLIKLNRLKKCIAFLLTTN